ncbi:MAG TPA: SMC family ATPase [candidate division Zixibacteria bacterium]|nr:SMC family ATPase [candidate division Zixibacteria bacterium]
MKKFQIAKLKLENIKTYVYEEVHFSEGNNVLIGENGAGKSTVLESIFLSIFGETVPGRRLVDMIRYGERQGKITLNFNVNGESYRIEDEISKKDEDRAIQQQVLVNEESEEIIAEGKNALRVKIEEILNVDATTFSNAIYASQGEIGKIITSKSAERKKLFDRLFQIDKYEIAWSNLSKVERIINSKITLLKQQTENLKEDLKSLPGIKTTIKQKEEQMEKEKITLNKLKEEFEQINKKYVLMKKYLENYNKLIGERNALKGENSDLKSEITTSFTVIQNYFGDEKIECHLEAIGKLENRIKANSEKISNELIKIRDDEKNVSINISKIKEKQLTKEAIIGTISDNKSHIKNEIESYMYVIQELDSNINKWGEMLPEISEKNKTILQTLKKDEKRFQNIQEEIKGQNSKLRLFEESSDGYNRNIIKRRLFLSNEAGDNWKEIIEEYSKRDLKKEIALIDKDIEKFEKEHIEHSNKKSMISVDLERIKNDLEHLKNLKGEETCPTCKQNLSADTLETLDKKLKEEKSKNCDERKILSQRIEEIEKMLTEIKINYKDLTQKEQLFSKIKPTYDNLLELEEEKKKVDLDCKKIEEQLKKLENTFSQKKIDELVNDIESCEEIQRSIQAANKDLPKLIDILEKVNEDEKKVDKIDKEIKKLQQEFTQEFLIKLQSEIKKYENKQDSLEEIQNEIKTLVLILTKLDTNNGKINKILDDLDILESREEFKDKEIIEENWSNTSKQISSIQTSVKNLKEEIIPPLIEQKKQLLSKEKDLIKFDQELTIEDKKKEITSILRSLMRELPNRLLPNYISKINSTSTEILQSIIPESDIQGIVVNDDYSINIIRLGNFEDISVLSGGETVIIALALRLAFAKEFSSLDILILDEPTIFLDERRRGELVSVLEMTRLVGQMFVVTHDPDFEKISDKTHFINKSQGESTIHQVKTGGKDEDVNDMFDMNLSNL